MIYAVKDFGVINKAEVDVLEFSFFFDDPVDVGNLISGSSAFSKSSWNIWKFSLHLIFALWIYLIITFNLKKKRQRNQTSNCQHSLDHRKSKRIPEKLELCFIDHAKAFDCVDHNKLEKF